MHRCAKVYHHFHVCGYCLQMEKSHLFINGHTIILAYWNASLVAPPPLPTLQVVDQQEIEVIFFGNM